MTDLTRRHALTAIASTGLLCATNAAAMPLDAMGEPLSVQLLSLREPLLRNFDLTLRLLRDIGYGQVELVSFAGLKGDVPSDFGPVSYLPAREIRRHLERAGLFCKASHFVSEELSSDRINQSVDWAEAIGIEWVIFTGYHPPAHPTLDDMKRFYEVLAITGERVRRAGKRMSVHSLPSMWLEIDGHLAGDQFVEMVAPEDCAIQLDFASVVQAGDHGPELIARYAQRINSLHLRDSRGPAEPATYLPALPLGAGTIDWQAVMRAARSADIRNMVLEMQLRPLIGVFDSLVESADYLRKLTL